MSFYWYLAIVSDEECAYKTDTRQMQRHHTHTVNIAFVQINIQNVYSIPLGEQEIWPAINRTRIKANASGRKITVLVHQCYLSKNTKLYLFGKPTGIRTIFSNLEKSC